MVNNASCTIGNGQEKAKSTLLPSLEEREEARRFDTFQEQDERKGGQPLLEGILWEEQWFCLDGLGDG